MLDASANSTHSGIFVAKSKKFYHQEGLHVEILPHPTEDKESSVECLLNRSIEMAVMSAETVISLQLSKGPSSPVAVASLLQVDQGVIAAHYATRPKELEGKTFVIRSGDYEVPILKEVIKADGGRPEIHPIKTSNAESWRLFLEGKAEATFIYRTWEGLQAESKRLHLNYFYLEDFGVPSCYSPVLVVHPDVFITKAKELHDFLKATSRGYAFCVQNPEETVDILLKQGNLQLPRDVLLSSQEMINESYFNEQGEWGKMKLERWKRFAIWLIKTNIILDSRNLNIPTLFTNEFLHNFKKYSSSDCQTEPGRPEDPVKWNMRYQELYDFYKSQGHSNVPAKQGSLGIWVMNQRARFKKRKLSEDRIKKLELIGFRFSKK